MSLHSSEGKWSQRNHQEFNPWTLSSGYSERLEAVMAGVYSQLSSFGPLQGTLWAVIQAGPLVQKVASSLWASCPPASDLLTQGWAGAGGQWPDSWDWSFWNCQRALRGCSCLHRLPEAVKKPPLIPSYLARHSSESRCSETSCLSFFISKSFCLQLWAPKWLWNIYVCLQSLESHLWSNFDSLGCILEERSRGDTHWHTQVLSFPRVA